MRMRQEDVVTLLRALGASSIEYCVNNPRRLRDKINSLHIWGGDIPPLADAALESLRAGVVDRLLSGESIDLIPADPEADPETLKKRPGRKPARR